MALILGVIKDSMFKEVIYYVLPYKCQLQYFHHNLSYH